MRSPTLVSGVASFSPKRSLRCSQPTGVASPCSAIWRCAQTLIGASGCSLSSLPVSTGVHSSSRPTSVRIRRVLPWPRSPSRTRSWPAMRARSTSGSTVSSKPTMPGRLGSPRPRRASRLARISALTGRGTAPLARSSPRVVAAGEGVVGPAASVTPGTVRRRRRERSPRGSLSRRDRRPMTPAPGPVSVGMEAAVHRPASAGTCSGTVGTRP